MVFVAMASVSGLARAVSWLKNVGVCLRLTSTEVQRYCTIPDGGCSSVQGGFNNAHSTLEIIIIMMYR